MRHKWLIKDNNNSIIVFFNGWGMDETPFNFLKSNKYDVICFYDYCDLNIEKTLIDSINAYESICLAGFSMGVFVAGVLAKNFKKKCFSLAINGTMLPIDDKYGIPPTMYQATLDNLSELTIDKFYRRMFISKEYFEVFLLNRPERAVDNQKNELNKLKEMIFELQIEEKNSFFFDRAIISDYDKIIPSANQLEFWKNRLDFAVIKEGHFPFYIWNSWDEVIDYAIQN
jgi:hypothetical protein